MKRACLLLMLCALGCQQPTVTPPSERNRAVQETAPRAVLRPVAREVAPLSLTASDGTGLKLRALEARTVIQGPLAFTELHMTFVNPENRVLEGRFNVTLPPGAAVSRLAMRLEKGWQEAEVVELQAARQAYEDFLHRRQDPALLEKQAGNEFQARIFPIPAHGQKEIIVSYSQELLGNQPYVLPLAGLPRMDRLNVTAHVGVAKPDKLTLGRDNEAPAGDYVVEQGTSPDGLTYGKLALVKVRPEVPPAPIAMTGLMVLFDTSASRAAGYEKQIELLGKLLADLGKRYGDTMPVQVVCFDQELQSVYTGPLRDFSPAPLRARRPLGATDLASALKWAGENSQGYPRLVVMTDGISTAGLEKLTAPGFERVDAVLVGGIREASGLATLGGVVLDGDQPLEEVARRLSQAVESEVPVEVEGALWRWPEKLDNVQPGDERLVYCELKDPAHSVRVRVGSRSTEVALAQAPAPLLERSLAAAQIARLVKRLGEAADDKSRESLRNDIVQLSCSRRVVCDLTGLLVLETEADYVRFKIDRKALADVLTVGDEGLELRNRGEVVVPDRVAVKEKKQEMALRDDGQGFETDNRLGDGNVDLTASPALPGRPAVARPGSTAANESSSVALNWDIGDGDSGIYVAGEYLHADNSVSSTDSPARLPAAAPRPQPRSVSNELSREEPWDSKNSAPPYTGKMEKIMQLIARGEKEKALQDAIAWQSAEPGDVVALMALGEALEALGRKDEAARVYGSLIDLYPGRADLRRYAGNRLDRLKADALALDTYEKAAAQRPDHPSSHRLLAYARLRQKDSRGAFEAVEAGLARSYPGGRFAAYDRILKEDLGILGAAWIAHDPKVKADVLERLKKSGARLAEKPSTRCVLTWETDANDVDFHIQDAKGGHAWYSNLNLPSGGELFADVTTGYGPECFAIPGVPSAAPYRLQAHYYSRGPMGYGMGKLEIVKHDGKGGLTFEQRPFLVMNDQAYVDLGTLTRYPADAEPAVVSKQSSATTGGLRPDF
ncbi:MAG: hypothetical protein AMXMBFR33_67010 [Candidatus Xenobia bacterium]